MCSWVPPSVSVLQSLLCVMDNSQVACPLRSRLSLLLSTGRQVLDRWQAAIALKCHNQLVGINLNSCYVLSREEWRGQEKRGEERRGEERGEEERRGEERRGEERKGDVPASNGMCSERAVCR